jgi:hypothetical protein
MARGQSYRRDRSRASSTDSRSSYVSDLDEWCENDSETDLTDPEPSSNDHGGLQLRKPTPQHDPNDIRTLYTDPADDTDENLSDVDSDYG